MPYYRWHSINEAGCSDRGINFAQSVQELDEVLLRQRKALISFHETRKRKRSSKTIRFLHEEFFSHCAHLMGAGVLVPDALDLCAQQAPSADTRHTIYACATRVRDGNSLSSALAAEEALFSPLVITMIKVGEESGALAPVMEVLSQYAQSDAVFYKRLQSALLGPLVTLFFFLVVAVIFLLVAVPHFASMMATVGVAMPPLTQKLMAVHGVLAGWGSVIVAGVLAGVGFLLAQFWRRLAVRDWVQKVLLKVSLYGEVVRLRSVAQMSRALALLLEQGVQIPTALVIVQGIISHPLLKKRLIELEELVRSGYALSDSLTLVGQGWLPHEVPVLVRLGEASGNVGPFFDRIARTTQEQLDMLLTRVTTLVQPAAMVVLGLLVALLITAIYVPLLEMAQGI